MKLGVLTAILGEHHLAFRDNLCAVPHDEREHEEGEGALEAAGEATGSRAIGSVLSGDRVVR